MLIKSEVLFSSLQEAKQAVELIGRWEMIDVSDALELLSPVFESEEVSDNTEHGHSTVGVFIVWIEVCTPNIVEI